MIVVHGTKKFLDRVGIPDPTPGQSTSILGTWYATVLFARPQIALFVNERTLLPVLTPMAPAGTLLARLPTVIGENLKRHGIAQPIIDSELSHMSAYQLAKTSNRSVVGIMNEFSFLYRLHSNAADADLLELSVQLAATPCGRLYKKHVSPDRELRALADEFARTDQTQHIAASTQRP